MGLHRGGPDGQETVRQSSGAPESAGPVPASASLMALKIPEGPQELQQEVLPVRPDQIQRDHTRKRLAEEGDMETVKGASGPEAAAEGAERVLGPVTADHRRVRGAGRPGMRWRRRRPGSLLHVDVEFDSALRPAVKEEICRPATSHPRYILPTGPRIDFRLKGTADKLPGGRDRKDKKVGDAEDEVTRGDRLARHPLHGAGASSTPHPRRKCRSA